jgi:hypothetical protein
MGEAMKLRLLVAANVPSSPILVTLMMEAIRFSDPHGLRSQKTGFFIVITVKT